MLSHLSHLDEKHKNLKWLQNLFKEDKRALQKMKQNRKDQTNDSLRVERKVLRLEEEIYQLEPWVNNLETQGLAWAELIVQKETEHIKLKSKLNLRWRIEAKRAEFRIRWEKLAKKDSILELIRQDVLSMRHLWS